MEKNKPVERFRRGCITASVWLNRNEQGKSWYTITIKRSYKDGDEWRDTSSFRLEDLPLVEKVADKAFAWIWDQPSNARTEPEQQAEVTK